MKKIIVILTFCWVGFGSTAFAACSSSQVKGVWDIYFGFGPVAHCTLKAPHISSGSSCYLPGFNITAPLTGNLTLRRNCHVDGKLNINGTVLSVDAQISKDKENITGMVWNPLNNLEGGIFSGVKR
jgi:hypothetical protein